jgi:hypothetical protein
MNLDELDLDDLLGIIKYQSQWRFFVCTVVEWILDYARYDPSCITSQNSVLFRNGLLEVNDRNFSDFLNAIQRYELSYQEVRELLQREDANHWSLQIVIVTTKNFM